MKRHLNNELIGKPVICPACKGYNKSGTSVPINCMWCSKKEEERN